MNPATRIGRYLLMPTNGIVIKLSRREQLMYALGLKTSVGTPTGNPSSQDFSA